MQNAEHVYIKDRAHWRVWLAENYDKVDSIWLVYDKAPNRNLTYEDMVEEALCFGWIDSTMKPVSSTQAKQYMCQRKKGSVWSALNKRRIEKLVERGLMTPAGLAKIDSAKADGSWTALDDVENLVVPPDLAEAFAANPQAKANYDCFGRGAQKMYLYWLKDAKRTETRQKRIIEIVSLCQRGIKNRQNG